MNSWFSFFIENYIMRCKFMNHNELRLVVANKPGFQEKYPFDPMLPVFYVGSKMFAILGHTNSEPSVSLKCDPDQAWLLREQYPGTVIPGYHLNKRHWNTVILNGEVPNSELTQMVEESYGLVAKKLTKAEKQQLGI